MATNHRGSRKLVISRNARCCRGTAHSSPCFSVLLFAGRATGPPCLSRDSTILRMPFLPMPSLFFEPDLPSSITSYYRGFFLTGCCFLSVVFFFASHHYIFFSFSAPAAFSGISGSFDYPSRFATLPDKRVV